MNARGDLGSTAPGGLRTDQTQTPQAHSFATSVPSIALPKGGGAIRGLGEKFAANAVTGTASVSVPISTSAGRAGFGPQLALGYDSANANGPFGFGWSLGLPQISRKTDKGLPLYNDTTADERLADVFLLSGAEDLVPAFQQAADGSGPVQVAGRYVVQEQERDGYLVRQYRPRIEGLFARIERWTRLNDGDTHWRSISTGNVLTLYGKDIHSRIADPDNLGRVFAWLISETRDDIGNVAVYRYKAEDGAGVDLAAAHERHRGPADDPRRSANRYPKRILYGNRVPQLDAQGRRPRFIDDEALKDADWMFEVVFDYGEHDPAHPRPDDGESQDPNAAPQRAWAARPDPFSNCRAGFEVRTQRLCQRVLMFHHFDGEADVGRGCLVRSTDFSYARLDPPPAPGDPVYAMLRSVTPAGYRRDGEHYLKKALPSLGFGYSPLTVQDVVQDVPAQSLDNLPIGLDGTTYQWTDLHGEGLPGILTEQAGAWFYKRNLSPADGQAVEFGPLERVASRPSHRLAGGAQFMDLAGDGQPDLVVLDDPVQGLYEHDMAEGWQAFHPFRTRLNRDWHDPNLRWVDLDGDGHADVLITEDDALVWHASLAEEGFGPARRMAKALDEAQGPRVVFADGTQSIYLADLSGDGLTDIVRIRNGEVCYWPNLGHGRFGAKVTMDDAPWFDAPDRFDQRRVRLADVDGAGCTDILYLHPDAGVRLYFNQCGNRWSEPQVLGVFPPVDDAASTACIDLLGNGCACLVWSSPWPANGRRPMRYVNLMGGGKPHLLVQVVNNLGAETRISYAPSTRFYLQDKLAGQPWITRLPFPVQVVERVETFDHISRNRFVSRYAYHHGYFDPAEREFRGFGLVEQWDTEQLAALTDSATLPPSDNQGAASHLPPVLTKTWFHTGVYLGRERIADHFAGLSDDADPGGYFREPGLSNDDARRLLLADTVLPAGLAVDDEAEACRALKGSMLRQEVYALDGSALERFPYTVTEQNFSLRVVQPRAENRHAVFSVHPREALTFHYERNPADPRIQHAATLQVDDFGNVQKSVAIAYGRRPQQLALTEPDDRARQTQPQITLTECRFTNPAADCLVYPDDHRGPMPAASCTYELTGLQPEAGAALFSHDGWLRNGFAQAVGATEIAYEQPYERLVDPPDEPPATPPDEQTPAAEVPRKRLIERQLTLYRPDDLGVSAQDDPGALLPLAVLQPLALQGESYQLAFTPGLLTQVFQRDGQPLWPDPAQVLAGPGADRGGYVSTAQLQALAGLPAGDAEGCWWVPSGRSHLSPISSDSATQELAYARRHFFLVHRFRDPFHSDAVPTEQVVRYDTHDLLLVETRDAVGNRVTVGGRLATGEPDASQPGNDYRVLQPRQVMDENRNRSRVAFDALGLVVGTAVMGKPEHSDGDSLDGFWPDLTDSELVDFLSDPLAASPGRLGRASTRLVYDLFAYQRSAAAAAPQPAVVCMLTRETHDADLAPGQPTRIQHRWSYSDGFGREIQKKARAETGPLAAGAAVCDPRWVGSGWTVYNNKGKPVRQYEPFFSATPNFEFGLQVGVSPILFYDPVQRVVATLHPNHSHDKVLFSPWQRSTWDANDTVLTDPRTDADIAGYVAGHFAALAGGTGTPAWQTWYGQRQGGALGAQAQAAAAKAAAHAHTPETVHLDVLGRPFLTLADNGPDPAQPQRHLLSATRTVLDIEGNRRAVRDAVVQAGDALGRIVMQWDFDLLGHPVRQRSMDAGTRWMLNDVAGKPIRVWDSRGHRVRSSHDPLRRPLRTHVAGIGPDPDREWLTERLVYGEQHPQAELCNLRGTLCLHFDPAGRAAEDGRDFKGNSLRSSRRMATQGQATVDWRAVDAALPAGAMAVFDPTDLDLAAAALLEADAYRSETAYDALNRPVTLSTPRTPTMLPSLIRQVYDEGGLLDRVEANLRGASANGQPVWTAFVTRIDHDAKGQRQRIDYGNGTSTVYAYDPLTFRLVHLLTRRDATRFAGDCPQPAAAGWPGCQVQNLHYSHDPVGNITHIRDDAQQTLYFRNRRVEPSAEYSYDALYRLIQASGREHLGQMGGAPVPHTHDDAARTGIAWSANDGNAMGTYVEQYAYDAAGNILEMRHRGSDPVHPGWKRVYTYGETSLIEGGCGGTPPKTSNRLSSTALGNGQVITEPYRHDAHGNMTRMPHLGGADPADNLHWDHRDQLCGVDLGGGGSAHYTHDAAGQRLRKVWQKSATLVEQRLYLGNFEIYRRQQGSALLERETLHIMDGTQRIALIETRTADTAGDDAAPLQLVRYQLGNHLASAQLELDETAQIVTYEEYAPYGSTTYQAVRSQSETPKRYRHTGCERDEESGLQHHGARLHAPWLARWTRTDPAPGAVERSPYGYCANNPVRLVDPGGEQEGEPKPDAQAASPVASPAAALSQGRSAFVLGALRYFGESSMNRMANQAIRGPLALSPGTSSLFPTWEPFQLGSADRSDKGEKSWNPLQQALQEGYVSDQFAGRGLSLVREGRFEEAQAQFGNAGFWYGRAIESSFTLGFFAATPGKGAEPGLAGIAKLPRLTQTGGRPLSLLGALRRFVVQDTATYPAVGSSWGGRLAQRAWAATGGERWLGPLQQGHMLVQQRWFNLQSRFAMYPANAKAMKGLERLGNAGWNLLPLPQKVNRWLGQTTPLSRAATAGTAGAVYGGLGTAIYLEYTKVRDLYRSLFPSAPARAVGAHE